MTAQELRAFRESLGLSRRVFAPKLYISEPTLERWEHGKGGPRKIHLHILRRMREELSAGRSLACFRYDSSLEPGEAPPDNRRTITGALGAVGALPCGEDVSEDGATWTLRFSPHWSSEGARITLVCKGSFRHQRPPIDFVLEIEDGSLDVEGAAKELSKVCLAHGVAWGPLGGWKRPRGLVLCQRIFSTACSPETVQHVLGNMRSCWERLRKSVLPAGERGDARECRRAAHGQRRTHKRSAAGAGRRT